MSSRLVLMLLSAPSICALLRFSSAVLLLLMSLLLPLPPQLQLVRCLPSIALSSALLLLELRSRFDGG
jgi:hypothetical protein